MKRLKFREWDSGYIRAYFTHDRKLYCIQPGHSLLPELLVCSRDGEPSHAVKDLFSHEFCNMPPDGDTWSWGEILDFFERAEIRGNGDLMRRMSQLFEVTE